MTAVETFAAVVVGWLAIAVAVALPIVRGIRHANYRAGHVHRCPRCRSRRPATRFVTPRWLGEPAPCPDRWHDLAPAGKEECRCC